MPERATYSVLIRKDAGDIDLSSYVTSINFRYGMGEPFQEFAPPARATLLLANETGAFNPDDSGAAFYDDIVRGDIIDIKMTISATTTTIFTGKLTERQFTEDYVTLVLEDQMLQLLASEVKVPLLTDVRVDEAILSVFDQQIALWPNNADYFTLDYSNLGTVGSPGRDDDNVLFGTGSEGDTTGSYANLTLDEARTSLAFAGDITNSDVNAQTYLRDLVATEGGGRFFWDAPNAKFAFQSRWRDTDGYTTDYSLTGSDIVQAVFNMDENLVNVAEVTYRPRTASNSLTVVYDSPSAITLKTSTTLTINANYQDPANPGFQCAGVDPVCTIGTDIIINTQQDGGGTNVTAQQTVTITFNATSATFEITNNTSDTLYITTLQVRAKPVTLLDQETVEYKDTDSIRAYDRRDALISLPALDNADTALTIAQLLVLRQGEPTRRFQRVTFIANKDATLLGAAKDARIGDGINIDYDSNDGDYVIVGQEHRIFPGGSNGHEITWVLKPADTRLLFTLDDSELDGPKILAF